jgi:SAM-dependent methyltransferase
MERYAIQGGAVGYERLQVLARSWLPTTTALLERAGLSPGLACLDLGSGAGDVTFELARGVGPAGRVVGLDMDDVKVDLARQEAAAQGLGNVEFRVLSNCRSRWRDGFGRPRRRRCVTSFWTCSAARVLSPRVAGMARR